MTTSIAGLHHVTAIASDPQRNLDFYTGILGLRFVKRTINFDDPGTYHFYFGDDVGTPGTILTFFPWPDARAGQRGAGETVATTFSIPPGSIQYWRERLKDKQVNTQEHSYFGGVHLAFRDPDGMLLELVEHKDSTSTAAPRYADVPAEYAVQGFFGTTLLEVSIEKTRAMLAVMGYQEVATEGSRTRFTAAGTARGRFVDVLVDPNARSGHMGAGTVHHIAFRAADDSSQQQWLKEISKHASVTPVQDRTYFHSIYFREPGGVLFEIATDNPGFLIDESVETLGEALKIPEWFEPQRAMIEARVKPIALRKHTQPAEQVNAALKAGVSR